YERTKAMTRLPLRQRAGNVSSLRARNRRSFRPFIFEPLEDRTMLAAGVPDIVVGRALSAYSVGAIQNNHLTIPYTVYNEQADDVTGVLLVDTLQQGVTFDSASALPDRNGQELAWSLGTVAGFDRVSVSLTVSLASPTPLQLDTGARGFGTLNA